MTTATRLLDATRQLRKRVSALHFRAPTAYVYNPLDYAARGYSQYVRRFAADTKEVLFLGMNPGPYGMVQTGVPFGEIAHVRDWMGITADVGRPDPEHPKRPVEGFACKRSEVSGARVWGAIAEHWKTPERFFERHFIANYCPLVFMEEGGRNRTPDKLPTAEREPLFAACDHALRRTIDILEPDWVIGIGAFAEKRAQLVLEGTDVRIARILHPSPANPRANRGWSAEVRRELSALGLCPSSSG
jgi:single-strand selective monofunctional uracil DNA glycosylase